MNFKYGVLIIGAGNIGAFFDTPKSKNILTHAHAFVEHKGFNLLGFVDVDNAKARKAASIWKSRSFTNIKEAFSKEKIDIVCVAVPDDHHYPVLEKISKFPFKLVLAEKPLTKTIKEANKIVKIYKKKNIPLVVNYSRRFVPEFDKVKKNISKGLYGSYIAGRGCYGKGLVHNGSHLIDLLRWYIGEVKNFEIINSFSDFYKDDPSVSAILKFKGKKPFCLQAINCNLFSIFEIDLMFEKKRVLIKDLGFIIEEQQVKKSKIFKGSKYMVKSVEKKTLLFKSTYYTAENIFQFLTKKKNLKCALDDGYKAVQICTNIIGKIKKRGE